MAENSVYYLSEVPGIDAIMFGKIHTVYSQAKTLAILKVLTLQKVQSMVYLR